MQNITYKQKLTGRNVIKLLKSVFVPIIVFVTAILTINIYGEGFGKGIVGLFVSLMWGISIVMAIIFPSQREAIIKEVYSRKDSIIDKGGVILCYLSAIFNLLSIHIRTLCHQMISE